MPSSVLIDCPTTSGGTSYEGGSSGPASCRSNSPPAQSQSRAFHLVEQLGGPAAQLALHLKGLNQFSTVPPTFHEYNSQKSNNNNVTPPTAEGVRSTINSIAAAASNGPPGA